MHLKVRRAFIIIPLLPSPVSRIPSLVVTANANRNIMTITMISTSHGY